MTTYAEFLASKAQLATASGLEIDPSEVHPALKPHQRDAVVWAVAGGRRAIFASFGLGKTLIQLEVCRLVLAKLGRGRALIVCPLGVRQEFTRDARLIGVSPQFIRTVAEASDSGIYMTNYESVRDGKLDPRGFNVVSLDEAAILRGFGGTKTFRELMRLYEGTAGYRFVASATPSPNEYIELLAYAAFLDVMDIGQAKAQPLDAKILTPDGWTTMGHLTAGSQVIAADGSPTRVLGVYPQGKRPVYRVTFSDGASTEADAEHLWLTQTQYERNNERRYLGRNPGGTRECATVRTTAEIAATLRTAAGGKNHSVPLTGAVELTERPVTIDPWLLGALLGDGCLRPASVGLSSVDEWILKTAEAALPGGLFLRRATPDGCDYTVTSTGRQGGRGPGSNPLMGALRSYGLLGKRAHEKRVPDDYLMNSVDVRLGVLRGLMDTDGTVHTDGTQQRFTTVSAGLADDVVSLVRSLGGTATICRYATAGRDAYRVLIRLPNGMNPFSLPRKAVLVRSRDKYPPVRFITSVEPVGTKPAQCIAIEHPSRLYVTDDFVVTHNTRFFKRDSAHADRLTLHPHMEEEFWLWCASWALFLNKPSDLGYGDDGYELPPLDVRWHEVPSASPAEGEFDRHGRGHLFRDAALGVTEAAREKRESLAPRVKEMTAIIDESPGDSFLIWHDLEAERHAITAALPEAVSVWGSQDLEERERSIIDFSDGKIKYLSTKPVIAGSGCNFQRYCHRAIFTGIGFKFHEFIQAIHRIHRFLQDEPVRIDLIYTEAERGIREQLERKWEAHNRLVARMGEIIREYGLSEEAMSRSLARSANVTRAEASGDGWSMVNNDAVLETAGMPAASIGLIVTSIPFSTQYEYTPSYLDFGHTEDNDHFWRQMDYLTPELLRVLQPGRIAAVHVKDRITPGGLTGLGFQTVQPFHAEAITHYRSHGFAYMGMITVVTDVVRENNQTYRLGWTENCKDGSKMGVGMPEYVLLFRRPPTDATDGYADIPVVKSKSDYSRSRWQTDAHGFWRSGGNRLLARGDFTDLPAEKVFKLFRSHGLSEVYDYEEHVGAGEALEGRRRLPAGFMLLQPASWHSGVWADVARMRTLNMLQERKGRQMHLCPLQFDIVDRLIVRYSNPGETVYDPFAGIGTVPYCAVKLGRCGAGVELNAGYFADAVTYCESEARKASVPTLFDLLEAQVS
jgi:hypothetical protein